MDNDPTKRKKKKNEKDWLELLINKLLNIATILKIIIKVYEEDKEYDINELQVLKREDKCRFKCLKCNEVYDKCIRNIVEKNLICTRNCNIKIKKKYVRNNIKNEIKWKNNLDKLKEFIIKKKRLPIITTPKEYDLYIWLSIQKRQCEQKKRSEKRKKLWEDFINDDKYKEYLLTKDELWLNYLKELKDFIDNNNRLPNKNKEEEKLHNWLYCNKYKNNNMKPDRKIKWEEFINDDKYKEYLLTNDEIWLNYLKELKNFIDNNNKTPHYKSKIGIWLNNQLTRYKNNKMNEKTKNLWQIFISNDKYSKYIISIYEIWIIKLNQAKNYIDIYKCIPNSQENGIGQWINQQKVRYKNNKLDKNRKKLWEDFINDDKYKEYLLTKDELWLNYLKELKDFIDNNNRLPNKNKEEKKLYYFLKHQREYYKNHINNNENEVKIPEDRIPIWEEFINDDKYKEYLITLDERWLNNLIELKDFIDNNNRLPNKNKEEKKLYYFLKHQREYYKNHINNNENEVKIPEDRIPIWEEFINDDKYKECSICSMFKSEKMVGEILKELFNNLGFTFNKIRPDFLKNSKTNYNLELDYYCKSLNLAFEYNGIQHYQYEPHFHRNGICDFENQKYRDNLKIEGCKKNNIILIIVPYMYDYNDKKKMKVYIINQINKFTLHRFINYKNKLEYVNVYNLMNYEINTSIKIILNNKLLYRINQSNQ